MIGRCVRLASRGASAVLIGLVRGYQATLSPWLGGQCRFTPTCSRYFIEAVREHGPVRGAAMGTWRLLRCNPLCRGGYDPVPPAGDQHACIPRPRRPGGEARPSAGGPDEESSGCVP